MDRKSWEQALAAGNGSRTAMSPCPSQPGDAIFRTICSFANGLGGNLYLGVSEQGEIVGLGSRLPEIRQAIAAAVHDTRRFNHAPALSMDESQIGGRAVLHIWVPEGPEICRYEGTVYERCADADVRVVDCDRICALALQKQQRFTERHVFPTCQREDLRDDLIERARKLATLRTPQHPWSRMSNDELIRSAGLWGKDFQTGEEGCNLAGILLFGTDEAIHACCPSCRVDALYAHDSALGWDVQETIATNLLDSFKALMAFCERYVDDPFVLEGCMRVSARSYVCHELVSNMLMHRDYGSPLPAYLIIDRHGIETLNASRPSCEGCLNLGSHSPAAKNPLIAGVFRQIGLAGELGSGTRTLMRYAPRLYGSDPVMTEGKVFRALVQDRRSR